MSRIKELFKTKKREILNVYCTAGYPQLDSTLTVMQALQQSGVDIIELGIPYSDPVADGPVIQQSNQQALKNGMSVPLLFEQLKNFRETVHVPVVLMGYLNPVIQYGFEKFCMEAASVGVDGLIIPDLPAIAFEQEYQQIIKNARLDFIFLVTPETTEDRIKKLDTFSSGFLYAATSSSTTGTEKVVDQTESYLKRLMGLPLQNPVLAGFGIKNHDGFNRICRYANGVIVGSAYITQLRNAIDIYAVTEPFIKFIRNGA
jgi:tryptophan synthase alpha chain